MKKLIYTFILLLAANRLNAQDVPGEYAGYLNVQGTKIKLVFHILRNEGKLTASFDSPDQNAMGLKIDETTLNGNQLYLNAGSLGFAFQGTINQNRDSIDGSWIQGGGKLPLVLKRVEQKEINKPVNPYETEIVLKTASGDINGTLTLPDPAVKVPLVLIIAGSGAIDRDGNSPPAMKNNSNCYKLMADELRKNGIASVRYDKRGIGGSMAAAKKEIDLRFENYVSDAKDWIDLLVQDKRFSKIIVAGHSEGSLIGMIACNQSKSNGFISVAGAGRPVAEVLKEQLRSLPPEDTAQIFPMLDKLKKGDTISNVPSSLYSILRPSVQPYMISWFKYDPQVEIKKLTIPVLIIQGDMDIQVSLHDAELLARANPKAELKIIRYMNHLLKDTDTLDKEEQVEKVYVNGDLPLDMVFNNEMVKFIRAVK